MVKGRLETGSDHMHNIRPSEMVRHFYIIHHHFIIIIIIRGTINTTFIEEGRNGRIVKLHACIPTTGVLCSPLGIVPKLLLSHFLFSF